VFARRVPFLFAALAGPATVIFRPNHVMAQNRPLGPPAPYVVQVTPKGLVGPNRAVNSGPHTETFWVTNIGSSTDTYTITCWGSGGVTCANTSQTTVPLNAGVQTTVTATYNVGAAGTGQLWLKATGQFGEPTAVDSGSYSIVVGAPIVDATPYNPASQSYARCAQACFAVVHAQGTVPYFLLDVPRNVVLAYNSDRVNPKPFVHVNVSPDPGTSAPSEYQLKVKVNGAFVTFRNGESMLRFANPSPGTAVLRIGGQFDAASYATNTYPMEIQVTGLYGGTPRTAVVSTRFVAVNETNAAVARGWLVAGVQRLYSQSDGSVLITEGDGSAVYFDVSLTAPAGEFSQLISGIPGGGSGWTRRYPDSTKVVFNSSGRMIEIHDRFNNISTINYDASNRIWKIRDPLNRPIVLTYAANGLSTVQDSAGRTTTLTVDASMRLTAIQDPDGVSTTFGYDSNYRLTSVTNRGGATTSFAYDTAWKVKAISSPAVTYVGANGADSTGSLVDSLNAWQLAGVPIGLTATTAANAPTADTVYARLTDPGGHVTRFTVNRWGSPQETRDTLGFVTTTTFEANGLPIRVVYPTGAQDTAAYNATGLPTYVRAAGQDSARYLRYAGWAQADSIWGYGQPHVRNFIGPNGRVDSTRAAGGTGEVGVTRYVYESRGRIESVTDPEGHLAARTWYAGVNGNRSRDSLPGGQVTTYGHDTYGRQTTVTPPGLAGQTVTYDVLNRVVKDSAAGLRTLYGYDSLFLKTVTDAKNQVYGFTYNALGWLITRTDPVNKSDQYAFGREGELRRWTNRRNQATTYTYDAGHRPTKRRWVAADAGATPVDSATWTYSTDGRIVAAVSAVATDSQFFRATGQLDSTKTRLAGQTFAQVFRYTGRGLLDSVTIAGGGVTFLARRYLYDAERGMLSQIRLGGGGNTTLSTNRDLQPIEIVLPGADGWAQVYTATHDEATLATAATYADLVSRYVSYDVAQRVQRHVFGSGTYGRQYSYDAIGRLATDTTIVYQGASNPCAGYPPPDVDENGNLCTYGGNWVASTLDSRAFGYDAVGNRTDQAGDYGSGNRIRQFAGCTYVTDSLGDGNVLSRTCGTQTLRFHWTAESRLMALKVVGGDSVDFRYDAAGRLVRKDLNGSVQGHFLWEGESVLAELNATATGKIAEYSYYPGLDDLHALIIGTTPYFAHPDAVGNVIALTDSATQTVTRSYQFDAWGALLYGDDVKPFNGADRARFKGALWMGPEADVYYMRARWYESKTGRFLSEDPIGLKGGFNPYAYAGADPVNGRDPSGLDGFDPCPSGYELHTTTREIGNGEEETTEDCVRVETHMHSVAWGDQTSATLWAGAVWALAWLSQADIECWIATDEPHWSSHEKGNISVSGRTWCNGGVAAYMSVQTSLQIKHCTGMILFCNWVTVGTNAYGRYGVRSVKATAGAPCVPGYYRGYSLHSITFPTGGQNAGTTDNPHDSFGMYIGCGA